MIFYQTIKDLCIRLGLYLYFEKCIKSACLLVDSSRYPPLATAYSYSLVFSWRGSISSVLVLGLVLDLTFEFDLFDFGIWLCDLSLVLDLCHL